jgi:predicted transcriptional regulator of viral defense system
MGGKPAKDVLIAALADEQHGVVSRSQLLNAGLTAREIDRRVGARRLRPLHRGVYAVGHRALRAEGRWMAATLAVGGVLSHASAADAWDLRASNAALIEVTVRGDGGRERRKGLRVHRSTTLGPGEIGVLREIPITTPARTIIDLARRLRPRELEYIVDLADQRGLVDFDDLRHANSAALRALLSDYDPPRTRSEHERRFLALCDDHHIPLPEANQIVEGVEVDFVWRDRRLIVEVDGYRYHRSPGRFESDREKDVHLTTRGWRVLRFTWRQVTRRAAWVAAAIGGMGKPPRVSSRTWP